MNNKLEYRAFDKANKINTILKATLKGKQDGIWSTLTGNYSDSGGFEIYDSVSGRYYIETYFGPFIKAHTTAVNTTWAKTASKVKMKRINGPSYYIQTYFCTAVIAIIFVRSLLKFIEDGELLAYKWQALPIILAIYILVVELFAMSSFKRLTKRIMNLITEEGIEVEKI